VNSFSAAASRSLLSSIRCRPPTHVASGGTYLRYEETISSGRLVSGEGTSRSSPTIGMVIFSELCWTFLMKTYVPPRRHRIETPRRSSSPRESRWLELGSGHDYGESGHAAPAAPRGGSVVPTRPSP
jgi:hypothetical protein